MRSDRIGIAYIKDARTIAEEAKEWSDIDIALVSPDFTGDRFEDRRKIVPMRRKIDSRIEPLPFRPEDFYDDGMMVEEIKRTGVSLDLS